jgi:hypothetical protein
LQDPGRPHATTPSLVPVAVVATIAAALLATLVAVAVPSPAVAHDPPGIDRFMRALAAVESNGRYEAVNATSGAFGRYQILPGNWTRWAGQYLGDRTAPPTPDNQERVARAKLTVLYHWLGSWDLVAHWWLTGSPKTDPATFSPFAARYVVRVMALYDGTVAADVGAMAADDGWTAYQESEAGAIYGGGWSRARHGGYAGDTVAYSDVVGASATFAFAGRSVVWIGPLGPTRGRADVYVDGALVKTVDLRAGRFRARNALFTAAWPEAGPHVLRIEVVGEAGRPVAIDEFRVGP